MSDDYRHQVYLVSPGPRPPYYEVVDHVYGAGANVDTEGDSHDPHTSDWTWLYMQLRPPRENLLLRNPVVEISMEGEAGDLMRVASDDEQLAIKAAAFLSQRTGATLSRDAPQR